MKAILVIDMPKACDECPLLLFETETDRCKAFHKQVLVEGEDKPIWCPLKLLRKKTPYGSDLFNDYVRGYNDCIDDICDESE